MQIRNTDDCPPFTTKDSSEIREVFNPRLTADCHNLSLAQATLPVGCATIPHRHPQTEEIYTILQGSGVITIDSKKSQIRAGQHVFIPAGAQHGFINTGSGELIFYCFCSPAYTHEDTILEEE